MKKIRTFILGLFACFFAISNVSAADTPFNFSDIANNVTPNSGSNLGYRIGKFASYSSNDDPFDGSSYVNGIGIFFKNSDNVWNTTSFAGPASGDDIKGMSAFFTGFKIGSVETINMVDVDSNGSLTKTVSNITVSVTPKMVYDNKAVLLKYSIKNTSGSTSTVTVGTYNDTFLGDSNDYDTAIDADAVSYKQSIENNNWYGFNGLNANNSKYIFTVLKQFSGTSRLADEGEDATLGGGAPNYWFGWLGDEFPKNDYNNIFSSENPTEYTANSGSTGDSGLSFSRVESVDNGETVNYSVLIGAGYNSKPVITIDESTISPNFDITEKTFNLTENNKEIVIGGKITDSVASELTPGKCEYKINDKEWRTCDQATYINNDVDYTATIPVDDLNTNSSDNVFVARATNHFGTTSDEVTYTFKLGTDIADNPQTGINNNYIILGLILVGGVGIFIYSKKHNKFPQV